MKWRANEMDRNFSMLFGFIPQFIVNFQGQMQQII